MASQPGASDLTSSDLARNPVLERYSTLFSRRVDIVGDYAGSELFLIHGDSVLLHCFSDPHLDFDAGFQLLHATYNVESLLRGLVSRRCNFHLFFAEDHPGMSIPSFVSDANREKYLLARAAIIRHLKINLEASHPSIEVHVFPSIHSAAFADYLSNTDLYFVMCHDGASSASLRKRQILSHNLDVLKDEEHTAEAADLKTKTTCRQLILLFLEQGYNVALVNGLEYLDTKVMTNVLEGAGRGNVSLSLQDQQPEKIADNEAPLSALPRLAMPKELDEVAERDLLTLLTLSQTSSNGSDDADLRSAFLRHTVLLSQLPLQERLLDAPTLPEKAQTFLASFCHEARRIIESKIWQDEVAKHDLECDVADLVDGKLLSICIQNPSIGAGKRLQLLLAAIKATGQGSSDANGSSNGKPVELATKADHGRYAVLPFSNEAFDKHLAPVQLPVDKKTHTESEMPARIFREVSHWHDHKRPIDPKLRPDQVLKNEKMKKKALRRNQFFMAEMKTYAASLTNAVGKALTPETVIASAGKAKEVSKPQETRQAPKDTRQGKKKPAPSKKDTMRAEIAASKSNKDKAAVNQILSGWKMSCEAYQKERTLAARYQKAKQHLATVDNNIKRETIEAEVRLFMLDALLGMWIGSCQNKEKDRGLPVAALIWDAVQSFSRFHVAITKTISECLIATSKALGLSGLDIPEPSGDRPLVFTFVLKNPPALDLSIPISAMQFQLAHCGPYFERSIDSAPDPRVPFEPDAWQRKVLDEIDARRSLLVIAPTSAGKTFISFYAMKQVLESNSDDILVYVAPTKALVNQIAAEVQARYSKRYNFPGQSVWGIHTRDSRINNPTGCQILVTVPHILQIMLLAPSNAGSWSKRVKWIIFDEVHSIGQAEDGIVWEQLLLLAPCPIIALSATIGNAEEFAAWLESTQKAVGNELVMVSHPHRYSDLRKFVFNAPESFTFNGLSEQRIFGQLGLDHSSEFEFVHPVASLVHRARGMPHDFGLEARDCLVLWESMNKYQTPKFPLDDALKPAANLPAVIRKIDIIKWETLLKKVLKDWMSAADSPFEAVVEDLSKSSSKYSLQMSSKKASQKTEEVDETSADDGMENRDYVDTILPLLVALHNQDALPAIVFNYDRGLCEKICQILLRRLERAETNYKETSPKWKTKVQEWEAWKAAKEKAEAKMDKRAPKASKKKGTKGDDEVSKEDMMRESGEDGASRFTSFNPEDPIDGFHFAEHKKMSQEELAVYVEELEYRGVPDWLIMGLRRGVGVHHAGQNRKYRQICEILFRRGFLRVVIATGTLALGINMPCKTVVFAGDSVFLTALNYRQAAGRAGRRGFDMLGNVVFHGVSMNKVHRLMSSRLPDLNGHFPITTTLVLRLFSLLHESKHSAFAVRSINALLSQPRLYLGGEESKMTVLHHLRFSIEYLRRQYLLSSGGAPLNFAGLVNHLYFTENSAFAFHALLKEGYFHDLCNDVDTNPKDMLKELAITMAHLFGRQHFRQADQEFVEQTAKQSSSIVILPPMPMKAAAILRSHNESTLATFTAYVRTWAQQHLSEDDDTLPLTEMEFGGSADEGSIKGLPHRVAPAVRSTFVALSGYDDKFDSIHDLCSTVRSGVFLEEAVVPYVGLYPDDSDLPLNAYLYDFFNNGDVKSLIKANKIRPGDVWFVLNDFSMVLATIVTSLSNFMNLTAEGDLSLVDVRGEGDEHEESVDDKFLPPGDPATVAAEVAARGPGPAMAETVKQDLPVRQKKKKVLDSWDEGSDAEDSEEEVETEAAKLEEMQASEMPAWEEGQGLLNVLKSFKMLKEEFDTKFRAMWS
ncbi:DEAD/DEAH box helicase [Amniculicola lignicola CBS 123094]|uniref:DEAD/DEAH box helicase n=1 Tax=Amniculicola lignicola CBS 123094 TaxID=1392246 RepID=A0A6A5W0N1_9PLEO|nr:DEAD/DEAH box helicase [Amniculicola lignicola CBS 123094]